MEGPTSSCLVCNQAFSLPTTPQDFKKFLYKLEDLSQAEHCFATNFGLSPEEKARASFIKPNSFPFCPDCTPLVQNMVMLQTSLTEMENKLSCARREIAGKIVNSFAYTMDECPFFTMKNLIFEKWFHQLEQFHEEEEPIPILEPQTSIGQEVTTPSLSPSSLQIKPRVSREVTILKRKGKGDKMPISIDEEEVEEVTCAICNKIYRSKEYLSLHMRTHTGGTRPYGCDFCEKSFFGLSTLKKHIKTKHTYSSPPDDSQFQLEEESEFNAIPMSIHTEVTTVTMADGQEAHLIIGRPIEPDEPPTSVLYDTDTRRVGFDKIIATYQQELEFNQYQISKPMKSCELCGKGFANKVTLTKHIRTVHLKTIKVHCPICKMTTRDHYNLAKHLLSHDTKLTKLVYNCPVCGDGFVLRKEFQYHFKKCHKLDKGYPKPIIRALEEHEELNMPITQEETADEPPSTSTCTTEVPLTSISSTATHATPEISPSPAVASNIENLETAIKLEPMAVDEPSVLPEAKPTENVDLDYAIAAANKETENMDTSETIAATNMDTEAIAAANMDTEAIAAANINTEAIAGANMETETIAAANINTEAIAGANMETETIAAANMESESVTDATPNANLNRKKKRKRRAIISYMPRNRLLKNRKRLEATKQFYAKSASTVAKASDNVSPAANSSTLPANQSEPSTESVSNLERDQDQILIQNVQKSQPAWKNYNFSCFLQLSKLDTVMVNPGEANQSNSTNAETDNTGSPGIVPNEISPSTEVQSSDQTKRNSKTYGPKSKIQSQMNNPLTPQSVKASSKTIAPSSNLASESSIENATDNIQTSSIISLQPKLTSSQTTLAENNEMTGNPGAASVLQTSESENPEINAEKPSSEQMKKSVPPLSLTKVCAVSQGNRREIWVTTRKDSKVKSSPKLFTLLSRDKKLSILQNAFYKNGKPATISPAAAAQIPIPAPVRVAPKINSAPSSKTTVPVSMPYSYVVGTEGGGLYLQAQPKKGLSPARYPLPNKHLAQIAKSFKERKRFCTGARTTASNDTSFTKQQINQQTSKPTFQKVAPAQNSWSPPGPIIQSTHSLAGQLQLNQTPTINVVTTRSTPVITQVSGSLAQDHSVNVASDVRASSTSSVLKAQNSPHIQALLRNANIAVSVVDKDSDTGSSFPSEINTPLQQPNLEPVHAGIRVVQIEEVLKGSTQTQNIVSSPVPKRKFVLTNLNMSRRVEPRLEVTPVATTNGSNVAAVNSNQAEQRMDTGLIRLRNLDSLREMDVETEDAELQQPNLAVGSVRFHYGLTNNNNVRKPITAIRIGSKPFTSFRPNRPFSNKESTPIMRYSEHMRIRNQQQRQVSPEAVRPIVVQSAPVRNAGWVRVQPLQRMPSGNAAQSPGLGSGPRTSFLSSILQRSSTSNPKE